MTSVENDRLRALPVQPVVRQRPIASRYFEHALQTGTHERIEDADDRGGTAGLADSAATSLANPSLWRDVLHGFYDSLERSLPGEPALPGMLRDLLRDIGYGVQAGCRIPGDRWRLVIRLREDLLRQTNLEVACNGGDLTVVFRTADKEAYHSLVEALPDLNAVLERRDWGHRPATVFWVNPQDLE